MKDEIKKINIPENVLVALGDLTNGAFNYYKATETVKVKHNIILDYITNLQEENERLKEIVENLTTMTVCGDKKQIKNTAQYKLDIYKSRNEKAIEYIKTTLFLNKSHYDFKNDLLNILQGEDN